MTKVLIIGLDGLAREIIEKIRVMGVYSILGYDFNPDKFELFRKNNYLENNENMPINELLKRANVVILNLMHDKYPVLFEFLPFVNRSALLLTTNASKIHLSDLESILFNNKIEDFISCNFFFFPKVVINNDVNSRLDAIKKASDFMVSIDCPTMSLLPRDNDFIFSNLYQMSFIIQKLLIGKSSDKFFNHVEYDFLYDDLLINSEIIKTKTNQLIDFFSEFNGVNYINTTLAKPNLKKLDELKVELKTNITNEAFNRVLIEKLFISKFVNRVLEEYMDFGVLNFKYNQYNLESLKLYCENNITDIEMSIILMKEKLRSFLSILNMANIDLAMLKKYLNS